jgi:hypothetical protein
MAIVHDAMTQTSTGKFGNSNNPRVNERKKNTEMNE